jgi:type IV pilus assembly protein PilF
MKFLGVLLMLLVSACSSSSGINGDQQSVDTRASAKVHTELAAVYYEQNQFAYALDELKYALKMDSSYAPAYGVRGLVNMALLEDRKAEEDFRRSIDLDGSDSGTRNNYGWFLCQRGREKEAMVQFYEALKNPLYATPEKAHLNIGMCYKKVGKNVEAEQALRTALNIQPRLNEAMLGLAEISFARADYAGAKSYFIRLARNGAELAAPDLLLAIRIEHKLGDRNAEASYKLQLRKRYPDSRENQFILSGGR